MELHDFLCMNAAIAKGRRLLCASCPSPCEPYRQSTLNHDDGDSSCPATPPRWRPTHTFDTHDKLRRRFVGLGDVVAMVAQPAARLIDAVAGTNFKECGGCKQRRAALNKIVPNVIPR